MGSKIAIYVGENVRNLARQAGISVGSGLLRGGLYGGRLVSQVLPIEVYGMEDRLLNDGSDVVNGVVLEAEGSRIEIVDARVDVKKRNEVKDTALVNRSGKVKERIQASDYEVIISGSLFAERDKFPYYELQLLNYILSTAGSIDVASSYLCIFDIERLVLRMADFNQSMLKYFNVMPFKLTFDSDMDYDFLVIDN